ncbi:MAG: prepilin-type N-terminal cleavage/methylation domain-containing protein [Vicinamibacterales bacterium]
MRSQQGFSLVETVFALGILLIVALGLLPLGMIATTTTENQGHLSARTTEYAQDKLEQLLALAYGDTTSDTRVFPAGDLGGSGLTPGGSFDPDVPVDLYVDYLDINGSLLDADAGDEPTGWFYKRVWAISVPSLNLKQVTVTATVRTAVGGIGVVPQSTVTALKTFPF